MKAPEPPLMKADLNWAESNICSSGVCGELNPQPYGLVVCQNLLQ